MRKYPHSLLFVVILAALLIAPAGADIIMPGTRYLSSCVEIENTNDYPGSLFIIYPLWMSGGYEVMGPGNCTSFYKFATPSFYAVKEDEFNETAASDEGQGSAAYFSGDPSVIPSGVSIHSISAVPVTSPVTAMRTRYRIASLDATRLEIVPVSVQFTYKDGTIEEVPLGPGETPSVPSGPDAVGLVITLAAASAIALTLWTRKRNR